MSGLYLMPLLPTLGARQRDSFYEQLVIGCGSWDGQLYAIG